MTAVIFNVLLAVALYMAHAEDERLIRSIVK